MRITAALDDARELSRSRREPSVLQPEGQWQLQVQVMHWRGETWRGGQLASAVFDKAVAALRGCQLTSPLTSPSLTTDTPNRMAAVVSGVLPGQAVLHQYLLVNPYNSTVVEVAMWATTPPRVDWPRCPTRRSSTRWPHRCARRTSIRAGEAVRPDVAGRVSAVAKVVVHVMPKAEILDPQGQAIVGALGRLGYDGISDVRQGKRFELEVDDSVDDETVAEIAESLLANIVIEDWSVSREPS